jgi:hypothetical protein
MHRYDRYDFLPPTKESRIIKGNVYSCVQVKLTPATATTAAVNEDRGIKAQLTIGCTSTELRRKILEKPAMILDAVLNKARAIEAAATSKMEQETEQTALAMKNNKQNRKFSKQQDEIMTRH